VIWQEFEAAAPKMARLVKAQFEQVGVALIGTIRPNGAPRIDPIEPLFAHGHLLLGVLPRTRKALNLLRDPRCTVQNAVSRADGAEGEIKLFGRALNLPPGELWEAYRQTFAAKHSGPPPEGFPGHVFSLDIDRAVAIRWDTEKSEMLVSRWSPETGLSERRQKYP
jgi:hypothetical protein